VDLKTYGATPPPTISQSILKIITNIAGGGINAHIFGRKFFSEVWLVFDANKCLFMINYADFV
jgi:hypothetical protein